MKRGISPKAPAALMLGPKANTRRAAEGMAHARAWRERMRPYFEAIYGVMS